MRAVLYTHDMEPITVIELNAWPEQFLKDHKSIRIPINKPMALTRRSEEPVTKPEFKVVEITAEVFIRHGQQHLMLFTRNEESALLLESVFLPGQRKELKEAEMFAAQRGAAEVLNLIRQAFR